MTADTPLRLFASLPDMVLAHASITPNATAIIDGDRQVTFRELKILLDRVAAGLQRDGLRPKQAIAICAQSSIEYLAVFLGALKAGAVVTPLAPSSTADQLVMMLGDCAASALFLDAGVAALLSPVTDQITARRIALDSSSTDIPFAQWLPPEGASPMKVEIKANWTFNIIYASGPTGAPKSVVQSHAMRWAHIGRGAGHGYEGDAVTLVSTPLHSNTTLVSVIPALALGGTVVLMREFDALEFLALAEKHRATHAMLVPAQYHRIMALPEFDHFDLSSFKMKFSTSAPFAAALKADVLKRWPGGLIEYCDITEGDRSLSLAAQDHPDQLHAVGRPAAGHDIRLMDERGEEVRRGDIGKVGARDRAGCASDQNDLTILRACYAKLAIFGWDELILPIWLNAPDLEEPS
ncbi:MAG: class I adenylate-forming enzyme family protein [Pseudomonadota bacterium]|jgi:long-chain acyl-CoA synthetase